MKVISSFCLLFCLLGAVNCSDFQEREFIKRELSGPLIKLENIHRGQYYIYVADSKTRDTVRYALRITSFVEQHDIQVGDSLSKVAGGHTIWFYKKKNGKYEKAAQLHYD